MELYSARATVCGMESAWTRRNDGWMVRFLIYEYNFYPEIVIFLRAFSLKLAILKLKPLRKCQFLVKEEDYFWLWIEHFWMGYTIFSNTNLSRIFRYRGPATYRWKLQLSRHIPRSTVLDYVVGGIVATLVRNVADYDTAIEIEVEAPMAEHAPIIDQPIIDQQNAGSETALTSST